MLKGSCECGQIRFTLKGKLRDVIACHCQQCRKVSGHFWAATAVASEGLLIENDATLIWYRSSDFAQRGFCQKCGSTLFYERDGAGYIAVSAGALQSPTSLKLSAHIFTADKGDYYELDNTLPCYEKWSGFLSIEQE